MDLKSPAATSSQNTLAVLHALETSGTLSDLAKQLTEVGVDLSPEDLQAVLDAQVSEYRVLCGAGNAYVRLPAGTRAVANAALAQVRP